MLVSFFINFNFYIKKLSMFIIICKLRCVVLRLFVCIKFIIIKLERYENNSEYVFRSFVDFNLFS